MIALIARVPVRLRLTAAFCAAMSVVLLAFGYYLAEQLEVNLTNAIDDGLVSRADQIAAEGPEGQIGSDRELSGRADDAGQLLTPQGRILASSAGLTRPLLSGERLRTITPQQTFFEVPANVAGDDAMRVLAYRTTSNGQPIVVAAGASLEPLRAARDQLIKLLLVGGPLALLLASGLGYAVAAAALRPVDRMRRQADAISADDPRRLTLPEARDELRALGDTLNGMLDRLQGTLDRERAFTMDASHELRTPLAVLKAELEVALRPQRTAEEQVAALQSASEETDRLARLAEDLLVLARTEQQGLPIRPQPTDVSALVERVAARFAGPAMHHGVIVDSAVARGVIAEADEDRLEQAVSNLIANAVDHATELVVASVSQAEDMVVISVADDGPGFPAAFLPRAFERFTQGDASRRSQGTGLGLAIVRAIAIAHRGRAVAENRGPGGARVLITIPTIQEGPCAS